MTDMHDVVTAAIDDATKARARISKSRPKQVRNAEERQYVAAIAHTWFRSRRPHVLQQFTGNTDVAAVDGLYQRILAATDTSAARSTYLGDLRQVKEHLIALRGASLTIQMPAPSADSAPDFSKLAADAQMKDILVRRWHECKRCIDAEAHLAAIVMMGGLLEALFVARANTMQNKAPLFKAKATPQDAKTKKPLDLREWTLAPYIAVGHELGWITQSAKDVAVVLRDYRNYVHPEKERAHGIVLTGADSAMLWEIAKSLARQLLT